MLRVTSRCKVVPRGRRAGVAVSGTSMATCWTTAHRGWGCVSENQSGIRIVFISRDQETQWLASIPSWTAAWLSASNLVPLRNETAVLLPHAERGVDAVIYPHDQPASLWTGAKLSVMLPAGSFILPADLSVEQQEQVSIGWILGQYTFDMLRNKTKWKKAGPVVAWPPQCDRLAVMEMARAIYWVRDLITMPAEQLGPQQLAAEAAALAGHHGASCSLIQGDDLLDHNYPAIHTVGRASSRPPVLVDIRWQPAGMGPEAAQLPLLALVGKGVCFDTGGLNIKVTSMTQMKKDMGGAALLLGLAHLVMAHQLPVRLRVMVPAVENSISGSAFRPLDVLQTRAGISVENMNTDAEGRLILADALYEAATESPDLLIDAATLTGAARQALGPEVQALFCNDDAEAKALLACAQAEGDLLWQLPLEKRYRKLLDSKVADLKSTGGEGTPGAIVAALFLQEFVAGAKCWMHIDTSAWTQPMFSGPGRPEGGEAQGLRTLWRYLESRYQPTVPES